MNKKHHIVFSIIFILIVGFLVIYNLKVNSNNPAVKKLKNILNVRMSDDSAGVKVKLNKNKSKPVKSEKIEKPEEDSSIAYAVDKNNIATDKVITAEAPYDEKSTETALSMGKQGDKSYDLTVTYIERFPKYERFKVSYKKDQRFGKYPYSNDRGPVAVNRGVKMEPDPGETVTFNAHILNQGRRKSKKVPFKWTIDGKKVKSGYIDPLKPNQEVVEKISWQWKEGMHKVGFEINSPDFSSINNKLEDRTDGYFIGILIDKPLYDRFRRKKNLVGTYSFEDWINAQVREMRAMFKRSRYPIVAPNGIEAGFRIDKIKIVDKHKHNPIDFSYDGEWRLRDVPEWPDVVINRIDYGLLHELGHQIGLPDLYQMNLVWERNLLKDSRGNNYLKEVMQPKPGLMGGGSTAPHSGKPHFSSHSAAALNVDIGLRGGFFSDYVWDTPKHTVVRLLDNNGNPLSDVKVSAYEFKTDGKQAKEKIGLHCFCFDEPPIWKKNTSPKGYIRIPNKKAPKKGPTSRGHKLMDNPYGDLDVGTNNGVLLLKVQKGRQIDIVGLYVWQLNIEYWKGNKNQAIITLKTKIGASKTGWEPRVEKVETTQNSALLIFPRIVHCERFSLYCGKTPNPIRYARPLRSKSSFNLNGLTPKTKYYYQVTADSGDKIHPMAYKGVFTTK